MPQNPLQQLHQFGQSFWYDNITRDLLVKGGLKRLVEDDGLRGLTSNPTIFGKAIAASATYDATIAKRIDRGPEEIFIDLAVEDIQGACDVLRPVYDSSNGQDGFVSMEVFPNLARDAQGTLAQARDFWHRISRPNVMIKVPATPECIPVIKQLLGEGININITLLFGYESYRQVVDAFMGGLETLVAKGQKIDRLASVASLFVSRVDTKVDKLLDATAKQQPQRAAELQKLRSKAGIANAQRMYLYFQEAFQSDRFQKLRAQGAQTQRLLWASTSTKDPKLPDTMYVEALIGPETVDTMPEVTVEAYRDHGKPAERLVASLPQSAPTLQALAAAGIDMDKVLDELQVEGVNLFQQSFDELMQCIRDKQAVLKGGGAVEMAIEPDGLEAQYQQAIKDLDKKGAVAHLWAHKADAWTSDSAVSAKILNRLGWLPLPDAMPAKVRDIEAFAQQCRTAGFRHAVLLGMGGSSLAPEVLAQTFGRSSNGLELSVLDTTDPVTLAHLEARLKLKETLFLFSSKSGGTIEPSSLFAYFWDKLTQAGIAEPGEHFAAITDEGTGLHKLAQERKFRKIFVNPSDIGGRYSALSYFGLVPGALLGVDIAKLLERAGVMAHACAATVPTKQNPGAKLGAALGAWALAAHDKLTLLAPPELKSFGMWLEQLIAESTGKQGKGIVPIDAEPAGAAADYGKDRIFAVLQLGDQQTQSNAWIKEQLHGGSPVITLKLRDRYDLGQEFFRWEFATALAGVVLGINPFDEPNVQESKDNTARVIQQFVSGGAQAAGLAAEPNAVDAKSGLKVYTAGNKPVPDVESALRDLLNQLQPGKYFAITAYVESTPQLEKTLEQLRVLVRDSRQVATTLGFGPRFLHSTGQLHKGGANSGVFLQLISTGGEDRSIPGQKYGFATLIAAQAMGDYQSLIAHQRPVLRVDLGAKPEAALKRLLEVAQAVLQNAPALELKNS